jgi:hypothetical protein
MFIALRLRPAASTAPSVYDAALPDSASMTFAATTSSTAYGTARRNLSVSPKGDFVVYASQQGDSTELWYRSLKDASAHPIVGTKGATDPRISPDGLRVAYFTNTRAMLIPLAGGEPRRLLDAQIPGHMQWISNSEITVAQLDGSRLTWLDPEGGATRTKDVTRCVVGQWIPEDHQLICSFNGAATVMDPESGQEWSIRVARADGSPGVPLVGSGFRVVDGAYVVYTSVDGDLRAARYDRKRHLASRSVAVIGGVRSEAVGDAQYDLTPGGTLVFAPGANAEVGRIVRMRPGHAPEPLPTEAAAFQRYDLTRDGRWLAAAVRTAEGQELRIYDLRDGQRTIWLRADFVRHPLWNPKGDRLVIGVRDSTHVSMLSGTPGSGRQPDTLFAHDSSVYAVDPVDFHDDHLLLVQDWLKYVTRQFDPTVSPARFDTVVTNARFTSVAPDGRHVAFQTGQEPRVLVTSYPVPGRLWQVASDGVEPLWLSSTELLYRSGVSWYLARLNPATGEPLGPATLWGRDPRFADTAGWSNRLSHDGGIIYVQGPAEVSASYLRVVPNWVAQMKAAVAAANR